jgi:hypothetical protein
LEQAGELADTYERAKKLDACMMMQFPALQLPDSGLVSNMEEYVEHMLKDPPPSSASRPAAAAARTAPAPAPAAAAAAAAADPFGLQFDMALPSGFFDDALPAPPLPPPAGKLLSPLL